MMPPSQVIETSLGDSADTAARGLLLLGMGAVLLSGDVSFPACSAGPPGHEDIVYQKGVGEELFARRFNPDVFVERALVIFLVFDARSFSPFLFLVICVSVGR